MVCPFFIVNRWWCCCIKDWYQVCLFIYDFGFSVKEFISE
jgi:hypothetical protein